MTLVLLFLVPFTTLFQGPCYEYTVIVLHIMMHLMMHMSVIFISQTYAPFLMLPLIHLLMCIICP